MKLTRSDLQHNLFLLTFGDKLGLSPPNDPDSKVKRALDIGTGTGIWAVDFGEDHPDAEVNILNADECQSNLDIRFLVSIFLCRCQNCK